MEAVLFIGIQATGKTTFFLQRFSTTHVHINLDTLKTRHRESQLLEACLRERRPFVVDNTNILARERARYIQPAQAAGYHITGYFFQSRLQDALRRNQQRTGKAVIPVKGVVAKYRLLQLPAYSEGFDRLYAVSIEPVVDSIEDAFGAFIVHPWDHLPD